MKTPREVILEHHQAAEAKLEAIRASDLAAEARSERRPSRSLATIAHEFWQETFLPWRRVWIGVGAAWVVILGLDFAATEAPEAAASKPSRPDPEAQAVLEQQEELLAQLLGTETPPPPAPPKTAGPRSAAEQQPARGREAGGTAIPRAKSITFA